MSETTTIARRLGTSSPSWKRFALPLGFLALALILPHLWFTKQSDGVLPIFTVVLCAVYALFSLGLNIVVGFAGLLDLGYVAFFLFGAYVSAWLMSGFFYTRRIFILDGVIPFDGVKVSGVHISFWFVVIVAGVATAAIGVVIGAPTLRLKSDYLALVTLGFGEILPEVFRNAEKITNGTKGIGPIDPIGTGFLNVIPGFNKRIGPSDYTAKYYVILLFLALFVFFSIRLRDGRLGRAWMAIREDELAASLMGVPLMRTKLWSYAVGAFAGGVGGAFYATIVGTVNVDSFTFAFSIIILCAVILGGMGNVWGAILGGVVITWFNYTGLNFVGRKFNETTRTSSFVFALLVATVVLAVVAGLIVSKKKLSTRIVGVCALFMAIPIVTLITATLVSKLNSKGFARILIALLIGVAIYAFVKLSQALRARGELHSSAWIGGAAGIIIGASCVRLVRSDVNVDLVRYQFGFFGLVLVLMMLFRPEGLLPAARSKAVRQSEALIESVATS